MVVIVAEFLISLCYRVLAIINLICNFIQVFSIVHIFHLFILLLLLRFKRFSITQELMRSPKLRGTMKINTVQSLLLYEYYCVNLGSCFCQCLWSAHFLFVGLEICVPLDYASK